MHCSISDHKWSMFSAVIMCMFLWVYVWCAVSVRSVPAAGARPVTDVAVSFLPSSSYAVQMTKSSSYVPRDTHPAAADVTCDRRLANMAERWNESQLSAATSLLTVNQRRVYPSRSTERMTFADSQYMQPLTQYGGNGGGVQRSHSFTTTSRQLAAANTGQTAVLVCCCSVAVDVK